MIRAVTARPWIGLTLLLLAAAALRWHQIDREGLWYDELIMARLSAGPWETVESETIRGRPPVYTVLSWGWVRLVGTSDAALRSLPALIGVASVAAAWFAGRAALNPSAAWIAAIIVAFCPYQLYYSQEHRYYALVLLLTLLMLGALARAMRTGRGRWFAAAAVLAVLAFYTHPLVILAVFAAVVGVAVADWPTARRCWRSLLIAGVVLTMLVMPRIVIEIQHMLTPRPASAGTKVLWIQRPPWWAPVRTYGNFLLLGWRYVEPVAIGFAVVLAVVAVVRARMARSDSPPRPEGLDAVERAHRRAMVGMLLAVATLPVALVWVLSYVVDPLYVDRYLMPSAAAVYLLLAWAIVALESWARPGWITAALVVAMAGSIGQYWRQTNREGWRELAGLLDERLSPEDVVVYTSERGDSFETLQVGENLGWYLRAEPTRHPLDASRGAAALLEQVAAHRSATGRTWLVLWQSQERPLSLAAAIDADAPPGLTLRQHHRAAYLDAWEFAPALPDGREADPAPTGRPAN